MVLAGCTARARLAEVLPVTVLSPPYTAVMLLCQARVRLLVVYMAVPVPSRVLVPSVMPLFMKVTEPIRIPAPGVKFLDGARSV